MRPEVEGYLSPKGKSRRTEMGYCRLTEDERGSNGRETDERGRGGRGRGGERRGRSGTEGAGRAWAWLSTSVRSRIPTRIVIFHGKYDNIHTDIRFEWRFGGLNIESGLR